MTSMADQINIPEDENNKGFVMLIPR